MIKEENKGRLYDLLQTIESTRESRISSTMAEGPLSWSLKMLSITDNSVEVVSKPANAHQSLTNNPAPITSEPRLTVPATKGTWSNDDNSS